MRGSLYLVSAGLAGLLVAGCSKADKDEAAPTPTAAAGATAPARTGAAASAAVTPPGPVEGAVAGGSPGSTDPDPSFQLATEQPSPVAAAAPAKARFVVHPGPGLKMNKDFPTGLTLTPPAGVTVEKPSLTPADADTFDSKELAFSVSMSAAAPGEYKVPGTFKFAVCDEGACYPKKRAVELTLNVQ